MKHAKHTPGPWTIHYGKEETRITALGGSEKHTVAIIGENIPTSYDYQTNAQLIAAAPEMLEALSELIKFTEYAVSVLEAPDKCSIRENLAKAIEIVAKARGES